MAVYRTPDERFRDLPGYPFQPHYVEIEGMRVHYVDEGQGPPVLMLHGEPTWSYLYRKMIPPVARRYRAVAPDYVGFGRSDKWTEVEKYTFDAHYGVVEGFIEALDLRDITVVVQDWGGPLGLRFATQHPERMARLVILNTGLFTAAVVMPEGMLAWREYAMQTPDLPVGSIVQQALHNRDLATEDVVRAYDAPFPDPESKAGARAFPAIIPTSAEEPGAREMMETLEALARWSKPALVMFSDHDPIFPVAVGRRFQQLIPGAQFKVIEGAGHFLQEEKGEAIAAEMLSFMAAK
jgi:haloalkane dehalogenase